MTVKKTKSKMPTSVIGLDVGGSTASVAKVESGGVVVLNNEMSSRLTPTVLSLPSGARLAGASASPHLITQPQNAVSELRNLLGAKHKKTWKLATAGDKIVDGGAVKIHNRGELQNLLPEQLIAAFLTHLQKKVVQPNGDSDQEAYVLAVPHDFSDAERSALLDAATIAGLKVVDTINDLTAAALTYGYFQKDLEAERVRKVVFVDFGYSSVQAALVEFNESGFKVLNVQSDRTVGGRDLDDALRAKFAADFQTNYPNVTLSKKAQTKLVNAAEKVKRLMSANKNVIPVNVECLVEDLDFNGSVSRQEFEELTQDVFAKIKRCLTELAKSVDLEDLHSVEVIGGSSRVPKFKEVVQEVFERAPKTTLNADEAVSKGAALHCASLAGIFRMKSFGFQDVLAATIQVKHSILNRAEPEEDREGEENDSICTDCVQLSKIHKIFNRNELRRESTVTLKQRPEGDTIAVEYEREGDLLKTLIAVYQLELSDEDLGDGEKLVLNFRCKQGRPYLASCKLQTPNEHRTVPFSEVRVGGLTAQERQRCFEFELEMRRADESENQRQELKNQVEDLTFQFKDDLTSHREKFSKEEAWQVSMQYVEELQRIIDDDEDYPEWSAEDYQLKLRELKEKLTVFNMWKDKYQRYLEARKRRVSHSPDTRQYYPSNLGDDFMADHHPGYFHAQPSPYSRRPFSRQFFSSPFMPAYTPNYFYSW